MGQIVNGQNNGDVEHLPREHVDVAGHDALSHGLVQHAEEDTLVAVQRPLRLPRCPPGVEDEERVIVADIGRPNGFIIRSRIDQCLVAAVATGAVLEPVLDTVDHPCDLRGHLSVLTLCDVDPRFGIVDDLLQLRW